MARPHEDTRPSHKQIAAELRALILSGDMAPDTKVPSVRDLITKYGVVNQTIQRALKLLKDEQLLIGKAGAGVYVRGTTQQVIDPASYMPPAPEGAAYSWITEAAKRDQQGSTRLLDVTEVEPPAQVAEALGIAEGETAVMRYRLMQLNSDPAELVRSYYPADIARGTALAHKRRIKGGSPTLLAEMGYPPKDAVDRVSTRIPTPEEVRLLELPEDAPVLRTFRIVTTDERQPIEVSVMVKAGHLYELQYRLPMQ
ncbi:GntR family transcriptional regulator [Streptomyces spectabilis]|uniref:GntR family transcriptional regulator n=1 Tax=Streptomyces spectabilis TaxID=68270 RepID=A0A7W8EZW8_STRST|nr:GntR family transcriptional regulator [Streptomyces spectabilis]MBB5109195.1 GntR family transcriptional regulator [Streptomyces spectabilis]MCI3907752.1 GntR family transcriptional regulator [Streptomyces spectabilis]GGV51306.1 GntR family transcriptional regulator [Streptomyces spectabilis]